MVAELKAEVTGGGTVIVRRAGPGGVARSMELDMTIETFDTAYRKWAGGALIQDAFPMLDADEREFLITGITPDEWDAMFSDDEGEE